MKPRLVSDLNVKILGIIPVLKDKTGILNPQQIVSLSGLLTYKGESIKAISEEIKKKNKNLNKTIKDILQKSSLIGHASIATTPSLCLNYEGSKFLDSALTGILFSSSLVASGRRTETDEKDIIFPNEIFLNKEAREIYQDISRKIIIFFNFLLSQGISKDEASKILQYGIYGTGVIQLPIESIVLVKREYENEKEWMPEEIKILLKEIEKKLRNLGVDLIYATRELAPRNIYPYPNIFKDPEKSNLTRELRERIKLEEGTRLVSMDILMTSGLRKRLKKLEQLTEKTFRSLKQIKKDWQRLLVFRQEIFRDYNEAVRFKVLSSVPWRVWGEKKRHRTCPQIIESIYFCIERAAKRFDKFKNQIKRKKINKKLVKEIEEIFSVPPSVKRNPEFLLGYLSVAQETFERYQNLIRLKIKPRNAIFLIPRAIKIDILQQYDLYNLLTGYYPLRLCPTAEEEMKRKTVKEVSQIKRALKKGGYGWLNKFIGPKCETIGFCPEEKSCFHIKKLVKKYNKKFHQKMKTELRKKFEKKLKNLRK
ncbi:FAD-dependent thymidylate synthase [Patescibacteria group bacterium]|nr:FAD-dependent thymidylate synthase [Patescibacteria group bacterium]